MPYDTNLLVDGKASVRIDAPRGRAIIDDLERLEAETGVCIKRLNGAAIGAWVPVRGRVGEYWMIPQLDARFSAGVPLKTMMPCVVIPTHLGKFLLLESPTSPESDEELKFQFVKLSSFLDGLWAVRRKFEDELEKGRRAAATAEMRVANLRKCREDMAGYSDSIVKEHIKVVPVEWRTTEKRPMHYFRQYAVLRLTTSEGILIDDGNETHVAVVGAGDKQWMLHVTKEGTVEVKDWSLKISLTPHFARNSWETGVFSMLNDGVCRIRYVRDSVTKVDAIQTSNVTQLKHCFMLSIDADGIAANRWLLFAPYMWGNLVIYDTKIDKIAHLVARRWPSGAFETAEGLWIWDGSAHSWWVKFFHTKMLESLEYKDVSEMDSATQPIVCRRVAGELLEEEAFRVDAESGIVRRREDRHPGHYWVVAGHGPVPTRLRAPAHIYKQVEFRRQLADYKRFPYWDSEETGPWSARDADSAYIASTRWAGVVDLQDGVTVESIKGNPQTGAWVQRTAVGRESVERGEFLVKGNAMSTWPSSVSLEVPVTPGRWLWRLERSGGEVAVESMELTLWHESVAEVDARACKWTEVILRDVDKLRHCWARLSVLAPVISEEGLRAKLAEYCSFACLSAEMTRGQRSIALFDKKMLPEDGSMWQCESVLRQSREYNDVHVMKFAGGVALLYKDRVTSCFVGGGRCQDRIQIMWRRSVVAG